MTASDIVDFYGNSTNHVVNRIFAVYVNSSDGYCELGKDSWLVKFYRNF
jgi:hypothetical protein